WMRELLEVQQEVRDPQEFIQNLKIDLYPEEVYTFTPKGQVKAFPRGATPIDFAYAIHTDVGRQCVGARINGKMMPLRSRLKNVLSDFPGHKPDDVFAAIGYGKLSPKQVLARLVPADTLREKAPEGVVRAAVKRVLGTGEEKIKVRGFDDLMVFRARCCNPIL